MVVDGVNKYSHPITESNLETMCSSQGEALHLLKIPRPKPLSLFPFLDGIVLHPPGTQQLLVINSTAALIWCLLPEVDSPDALIERLVSDYAADPATAPEAVTAALAEFSARGLLEGTDLPEEPSLAASRLPPSDNSPLPPSAITSESLTFTLSGHCFKISFHDHNLGAYFAGVFGHLATTESGDHIVEIAVTGKGLKKHDVYLAGKRRATELPSREVTPWLVALVFEVCSKNLNEFQLLHAGVLARDGKAILLPGRSGSGKTTLTATMAANGWQYFSDELALIDSSSCQVQPFPQALVIKSGSLPGLNRYYPGLADLPVHRRIDGRTVRFLPPPIVESAGNNDGATDIGALFFPSYISHVKAECVQLSPLEALPRLVATGSSQRPPIGQDIEALIHLAESRPCYALYFDDPETVMAMIGEKL